MELGERKAGSPRGGIILAIRLKELLQRDSNGGILILRAVFVP